MIRAIDTKILIKPEKLQDAALTEKLGGFKVTIGDGKFDSARVVSVGDNVADKSIAQGSLVYTYPGAGHEITYEGETYKVISVSDILTVIDE